jgi:thiol-disulfide isomerase/thioredoxin
MTRVVALLVALVLSMPIITSAGPVSKYSKQALEQAQDAGKPVIVFVTASWCPNCRAQQPIVETLTKDPAFSEAVLFVVDFDSDKQALRDLNVTMQSTLIAFKGKTERKRSTAVTDPEQIRTLFQSAL